MILSAFRTIRFLAAQSVEAVVARASWFPAADELWDSAGVRAAAERLAEKEAQEEVSEPRDDGPRLYMNGVQIPDTRKPVDFIPPKHFLGLCGTCRAVKTFTTAEARDGWERHHPHDEGLS